MAYAVLHKINYPRQIRQYTIALVLAMLVFGYFGYRQYGQLTAAQDALEQEQQQVLNLQRSKEKVITQYRDLKTSFDTQFANLIKSLELVYPNDQNYTDMARMFDKFFNENNTQANPVFVSDLRFGQPKIDKDKAYAILPITLSLSGTRNNFDKFLRFIENSGTFEDGTRLMDIRSISMNFTPLQESDKTDLNAQQLLNVSVSLNSYYQKPVISNQK